MRTPRWLQSVFGTTTTPPLAREGIDALNMAARELAEAAGRAPAAPVDRRQLVRSIGDAVRELSDVLGRAGTSGEIAALSDTLVQALHAILLTAVDAIREPDAINIEMLGRLTGDRSDVMERIRQGLVRGERTLTVDEHQVLFTSTALFERTIRLLRRFQEGLGHEKTSVVV